MTKKRASEKPGKHKRSRTGFAMASVALGIGAFAAAGYAWSQHLGDGGEAVAANVYFNNEDVSALSYGQVRSMVALDADARRSQPITIQFEDGTFETTLAQVGFDYDVDQTVNSIMEARHTGTVFERIWEWATLPFTSADVEATWSFDEDRSATYLIAQPDLTPFSPVEPAITNTNDLELYVVPGEIGSTVDVEGVVSSLGSVDFLTPPSSIRAEQVDVLPQVTDAEAAAVSAELNELTSAGVTISVRGEKRTITPRTLRTYLVVEPNGDTLTAEFDGELLQYAIDGAYSEPVGEFKKPVLSVFDDEVIVVEQGEAPPVCCAAGTGAWVGGQILAGATGPYGLPARPLDDPQAQAWADGSQVIEKVSEFTTPHNCCESRVTNIQKFADLVRGAYVLPGESLSLNEHVGQRTRANGFVGAGAIRTGYLQIEVGGGVSQFATTIFNAAYFAGMDFDTYQSHSIYFSRYPYGREATISWPAPDLVLNNTTNYPILIWTSYTDRSITVSMYSTQHITVEELGQRTYRNRACRHVETERQRTYPDGRVVVDVIEANYRPANGIDCNGNPIPTFG